jgi:hypothetical protein
MTEDWANGRKDECARDRLAERESALAANTDWGGEDCEKLSEIVKTCLTNERGWCGWRDAVQRDAPFEQCVENALYELSIDDERTLSRLSLISLHSEGCQIEIQF